MTPDRKFGPVTAVGDAIHAAKYRGRHETHREATGRVASAISDGSVHYGELREMMGDQRWSPAGRIWAGAGAAKNVTLLNCLAAETPVLTREYGVMEIASLEGLRVHVLDGHDHWVEVEFKAYGEQLLQTVRLTKGRQSRVVRATPGHRWPLSEGGEAVTSELRRGDQISHHTPRKEITDEAEYLRGVQHGVIFGDGSYSYEAVNYPHRAAQLRLCDESVELHEQYFKGYSYHVSKDVPGDIVLGIPASVAWCDLKSFPENPTQDYLLGFIRGWGAADGSMDKNSGFLISGPATSEQWLRVNGPRVGFYVLSASRLADWITGSEKVKEGWRKTPTFNIRFDRSSIVAEDLLLKKHRDRWFEVSKTWRVAEVGLPSDTPETVYCAVVPTTRSFVLGSGMLTGNCYHSGPIEDSLLEGDGSIMKRLTEAMATLRMGGGIGYNFSLLRPSGALIKKLGSHSCGPVRFIEMYDAAGGTISSSGERRGAQMGMLRIDHPDVLEFIRCKQGNPNYLTRFNLSVQVTDEFMECLAAKRPFTLRHGGQAYSQVDPEELWETMMRSTWDWGDPGVFFIDRINRDNNLNYCEEIIGSNPCGEVPLPAFGSCLLGSHNLAKYLTPRALATTGEMGRLYDFDWDQFRADIPVAVRAMDNVVDVSTYPLYEQEREMKSKRRIGLGFTGLANAGEAQGYRYGSPEFCDFAEKVTAVMRDEAYRASAKLASERGAFPLYDATRFQAGRHFNELAEDVQALIRRYGIRNSHLLSIAPTGTISLAMDNVSSGLEPVFSHEGERWIRFPTSTEPVKTMVQDYGYGQLGVKGATIEEVTLDQHLKVLYGVGRSVDQSVSKTINVGADVTWDQFKGIYMDAYEHGCKSCTTFRPTGKKMGILMGKSEAPEAAEEGGMQCTIGPDGQRECA